MTKSKATITNGELIESRQAQVQLLKEQASAFFKALEQLVSQKKMNTGGPQSV